MCTLDDIDAKLGNYATPITNNDMPHGNDSKLADYDAMLGYNSKFGNENSMLGDDVNLCNDGTLGDVGTLCIDNPAFGWQQHHTPLCTLGNNNTMLG